jgi:hypothetical protein
MPKEIEDYVHQIGRTGRSGKTGISTTFVNMNTPEQTLLDLKYLLMEAGQKYVSIDRYDLPKPDGVAEYRPSYKPSRIHGQLKADHSKGVQSVEVRFTFHVLSLSPRVPESANPLIAFLQVWDTASPTVQSSRILSADRWHPTVPPRTLADIERL